MSSSLRCVALAVLAVFAVPSSAAADPGELDASFAGDGTVEYPRIPTADFGLAFGEQSDGSIVLLGRSNNRYSLARLSADGAVDATFGDGGVTNVSTLVGWGFGDVTAHQMVVLPDDRIVALYATLHPALDSEATATLARFSADGEYDTTFGDGGVLQVPSFDGSGADIAYRVGAIAAQPDGKLVLLLGGGENFTRNLTLVRLEADGSLDPTFGDAGAFRTDLDSEPRSLTLLDDGSILFLASDVGDLDVGKVTPQGAWDPVFNSGFHTARWYAPDDDRLYARNLALTADGSILVGATLRGCSNCTNGLFAIHKLTPDGGLDWTFSDEGDAWLGDPGVPQPDQGMALVVDGERAIFFGGSDVADLGDLASFAVTTADGALDLAWGGTGRVDDDLFGRRDLAWAAHVQSPGRLLVFGSTVVPGADQEMFVARYAADGTLDPTFGTGGVTTVGTLAAEREGGGNENAGISWVAHALPDGSVVGLGAAGSSMFVQRWLADGTPDPGFGVDGLAAVDFYEQIGGSPPFEIDGLSPQALGASRVELLDSGALLIGGEISYPDDPWIVARLLPDGSPDPTFGQDGRIIAMQMNWSGTFSQTGSGLRQMLPMEDGSVVLLGQHRNGEDLVWDRVLKIDPAGAWTDYGRTWVKFDWGGSTPVEESVDVIADAGGGRVLGVGFRDGTSVQLFRLDADAAFDPTFGVEGAVVFDIEGHFVVVQTLRVEGDTVRVTGFGDSGPDSVQFEIRTDLDGTPDSSFGDGGLWIGDPADYPDPALDGLQNATWRALRDAVYLSGQLDGQAALARFTSGDVLDESFGDGGVTTYRLSDGLETSGGPVVWYEDDVALLQPLIAHAPLGDPLLPALHRRGIGRILAGDLGVGVGDDDDASGDDDDASGDDDDAAEGCDCGVSGADPAALGILLVVGTLRRRRSGG